MAFDRSKELRTYQPLDSDLTAIAGLANTNSNFIVGTGSGWAAENGDTVRTSLGLTIGIGDGEVLTANATVADNEWLRIDGTAVEGRTDAQIKSDLDLEIGTDVQAYDAELTAIAALASTDGNILIGDGSNAWSVEGLTSTVRSWTGSQRATIVTANTGTYNLLTGQNFKSTPTDDMTITFSNLVDGQSGYICLDNTTSGGGHTITSDNPAWHDTSLLSAVTVAGKYLLSYVTDGSYVYITNSAKLTALGAE